MTDNELNGDLSTLIGAYGIMAIHKALMSRMKDEYSYLKKVFDLKEDKPLVSDNKPLVSDNKPLVSDNKPLVSDNKPLVTDNNSKEPPVEEAKFRDPKEMKEWQKGEEEKKRKENEAKGIKKGDLLTKENLKKWIEEEGRTFAYISREYVGCKDTEVSAAAKLYGIDTTRKNVTVKTVSKK